jgi:hypothetical protein
MTLPDLPTRQPSLARELPLWARLQGCNDLLDSRTQAGGAA